MAETPLLLIPGPVSVAPEIREAMSREMISNRSADFRAVYRDCQRVLGDLFGTTGDVVIANGTGTASMEMAVCNVVDPDDAVVCIQNGWFGNRFERIARRHSHDVRPVTPGMGQPVDLDAVVDAMDDAVAAVTMVHAETSTGIANPLRAVGEIAADHDALLIVDCVTSVATEELRVDEWGVDLAMTSTQKGIGAPPGLSALTVSERARDALGSGPVPFYLDLPMHLSYAADGSTPTTSPVPLFWALQAALQRIERTGLEAQIADRRRFATAIREQAVAMGFAPFPTLDDRSTYTNGVTVLELPEGLNAGEIATALEAHGVLIKTGIPPLDDDLLRIGSMGAIGPAEILFGLTELQTALSAVGYDLPVDDVDAARAVLE